MHDEPTGASSNEATSGAQFEARLEARLEALLEARLEARLARLEYQVTDAISRLSSLVDSRLRDLERRIDDAAIPARLIDRLAYGEQLARARAEAVLARLDRSVNRIDATVGTGQAFAAAQAESIRATIEARAETLTASGARAADETRHAIDRAFAEIRALLERAPRLPKPPRVSNGDRGFTPASVMAAGERRSRPLRARST